MIQFKRGKSKTWSDNNPILAPGQPGYDKDVHKIKVGDGKSKWNMLPYVGGFSEEEILSPETDAKKRRAAALKLHPDNPELAAIISPAVITYGPEAPDKATIGKLYLQHYETEPEVDYVVETGVDGIWTYRKWHSGFAECWGTTKVLASVNIEFEGANLYSDSKSMKKIAYPFTFKKVQDKITPNEQASVQGPGGVVWLAVRDSNSESATAVYSIISPNKQQTAAYYYITIRVDGFWK
jgi:hyaluronoglucosaminidase